MVKSEDKFYFIELFENFTSSLTGGVSGFGGLVLEELGRTKNT